MAEMAVNDGDLRMAWLPEFRAARSRRCQGLLR